MFLLYQGERMSKGTAREKRHERTNERNVRTNIILYKYCSRVLVHTTYLLLLYSLCLLVSETVYNVQRSILSYISPRFISKAYRVYMTHHWYCVIM